MGVVSSRRKADGGYTPPIIHKLLKPITSGNTINVNCVPRGALPMPFIAINVW